MSAETPVAPPDAGQPSLNGESHLDLARSPEFAALRRALRRFVFPLTAAFLVWYGLYVLLSAYARDFMGTKVAGNVNVALVFGLLQFVSTFLIAWLYARYADRTLDPLAAQVRAQANGDGPRAGTADAADATDAEVTR